MNQYCLLLLHGWGWTARQMGLEEQLRQRACLAHLDSFQIPHMGGGVVTAIQNYVPVKLRHMNAAGQHVWYKEDAVVY